MLNIKEAKSAVKALYLQAASLSGFEVSERSPEILVDLVQDGFTRVAAERRPEAVANILRVIAATLEIGQNGNVEMLHEEHTMAGKEKVCPVYPFN